MSSPQIVWDAPPKPDVSGIKWDAPPASAPPSAGTRFMAGTGLTTGGRSLPEQIATEGQAIKHPLDLATETVQAPVKGYAQAAADQAQRASDHWHRARATGNPGDYLDAATHALYYLLSPVGGGNLGAAADESAKGNLAGAAGNMLLPTAGMAAGSPAVRSGVGTAVNAARTGTAAALDATAKPVATAATGITALHEFASGRPLSAAFALDKGKPFISKGMTGMAEMLRPGQAPIEMMPLTRQVLGSEAFKRFMNAPMDTTPETAPTDPGPLGHRTWQPPEATPPDNRGNGAAPAASYPGNPPGSGGGADAISARRAVLENAKADAVKQGRWRSGPDFSAPVDPMQPPPFPGGADFITSPENDALDKGIIGGHLPQQSSSGLLSGLRDHAILQRINAAFEKQAGAGESTVQKWIVDHDQNAPGGKSAAYQKAAKENLPADTPPAKVDATAQALQMQDEHMAELLQKSIDAVNRKKAMQPPPFPSNTAGTASGAAADTAFFQQARETLGADAPITKVVQLAQQLKTKAAK